MDQDPFFFVNITPIHYYYYDTFLKENTFLPIQLGRKVKHAVAFTGLTSLLPAHTHSSPHPHPQSD